MLNLVEIKDGLLSTPDNVVMKTRDPELFPVSIKAYFSDKSKLRKKEIDIGLSKIIVHSKDKRAVYDADIIDYIRDLGRVKYYLSNVPLPDDELVLYLLFAKYKHGWLCFAPLEA